jgi:hypothetical protein
MAAIALLCLIGIVFYIGYLVGSERDRDVPCPACRVRQQTLLAEAQIQQLTHATMAQMLQAAQDAQRRELP